LKGSGTELFHLGKKMKPISRSHIAIGGLCLLLLVTAAARAQQPASSVRAGYDPAREVNVVGTVSSFVANSETGPLGAHVLVQTGSRIVDVHVGSAKFLELNHLTLNSGDSVRIIGENVTNGSNIMFLARIVQKGTQAVAVRSVHGIPLWRTGSRIVNAPAKNLGGAL
jgi:hypothetical protein